MADYFTNFSLLVSLPSKEAQAYALALAHAATVTYQGDELPDGFPAPLADVIDDWQFETDPSDKTDLWLHSDSGAIDAVCAFIQHLLQRYAPDDCVGLEWSNDCSKPRLDAFGGGAAIITATTIKSLTTGEWLHRHMARIAARKKGG